ADRRDARPESSSRDLGQPWIDPREGARSAPVARGKPDRECSAQGFHGSVAAMPTASIGRIAIAWARGLRRAGVLAACLVWLGRAGGCTGRGARPSPPQDEPSAEATRAPQAGTEPSHDGPRLLLRGARVMTAAGVVYPVGDVLVEGDRIAAVGAKVAAPD